MSKKKIFLWSLIILCLLVIVAILLNLSFKSIQVKLNRIGIDKEQLNKAEKYCHSQVYGEPQAGIAVSVGLDVNRSDEEVRRDSYQDCLNREMNKLKNQQK